MLRAKITLVFKLYFIYLHQIAAKDVDSSTISFLNKLLVLYTRSSSLPKRYTWLQTQSPSLGEYAEADGLV